MFELITSFQHRPIHLKLGSLFLMVSIAMCLIPLQGVLAVSGTEFNAGRIIDNAIFYNNSSMNAQQIQNFLNAKVPACDTWGTQPSGHAGYPTRADWGAANGNPAPYTCLNGYRQDVPAVINSGSDLCAGSIAAGNKSATDILFQVSQACGINPQTLIVLLQKEQGLVTDDWPWSTQYRSATGYGCPDTAACDSEYYGFFNQVYQAAKAFKRYSANPAGYNYRAGRNNTVYFHPGPCQTYSNGICTKYYGNKYDSATGKSLPDITYCGSTNVYIENQATANLYIYTPYQPNDAALGNLYGTGDICSSYGNRNYWRMFNDWFGKTNGSVLVRTPLDQTVFLLTNNKRFAIPSGDILYAYGLERTPIDVVSESYLNSIPNGGMLSTLFTIAGDQTVYLADGNTKYGISSGEYCVRWGLACGDPNAQKEIGLEIFNTMTQGGTLQQLMRHNGVTYLMENGQKRLFLSEKAATERGFNTTSAIKIVNWTNAIRSFGYSFPENGSFVKFGSSSAIYAYDQNNFYAIPDFETFRNWYTEQDPLQFDQVSQYNSALPSPVAALSNVIVAADSKTYLVDGGKRLDLNVVRADWPAGTPANQMPLLVSRLPIVNTLSASYSIRQGDGGIFRISSGKKLPLNSVRDFYDLGYASQPVIQLSASNLALPVGPTLFSEGSAYKPQGSDAIYLITKGNKAYALTSLEQIGSYHINPAIPTVDTTTNSQFTYQSVLTSLVQSDNGQYYIVTNKGRLALSIEDISRWGLLTANSINLGNNFLEKIPLNNTSPTFFASINGTIFIGQNGSKRPIGSFATYKKLGGTPNNTAVVPNDILGLIPDGALYP